MPVMPRLCGLLYCTVQGSSHFCPVVSCFLVLFNLLPFMSASEVNACKFNI